MSTQPTALQRRAELQAQIVALAIEQEALENAAHCETMEQGFAALRAAGASLDVNWSTHSSLKGTFDVPGRSDLYDLYPSFGLTGNHGDLNADLPPISVVVEADDGLLKLVIWHNRHKTTDETTWAADLAAAKAFLAQRGIALKVWPLVDERDNHLRCASELTAAIAAIQA